MAAHLTRRKRDVVTVGSISLARWYFGLPWSEVGHRARAWKADGWQPDEVWITSLTSFWWRGVAEFAQRVRLDWWPDARIVVGGVYPAYHEDHARQYTGADAIIPGDTPGAMYPSTLSLYPRPPRRAGVYLYRPGTTPDDIVAELAEKASQGVREVAFFDEHLPGPDPERFAAVLDRITERGLTLRLVALANLDADAIDAWMAARLTRAGYHEITFTPITGREEEIAACAQAARLLETFGGIKPRTGALCGVLLAGRPGENLEDIAASLVHLASAVGSVAVFPYHPPPDPRWPQEPDLSNGKLFPFAQQNGATFEDYTDLLRLSAVLNSKYHDVTFDFLGPDLIPRLVRTSIRTEAWRPVYAPPPKERRRIYARPGQPDGPDSALPLGNRSTAGPPHKPAHL